jgi:hypothetical protein
MNWLNRILAIIAIGILPIQDDNHQRVLATSDANKTFPTMFNVPVKNDKQIIKRTNQLRSANEPSDCRK